MKDGNVSIVNLNQYVIKEGISMDAILKKEWYSELNKSTLLNKKHFIILPIYGYKNEKTNEFIMDTESMKKEFEMKIKNAKEALKWEQEV